MSDAAQHTGGTVGKVLWHVTLSLDGFIAGPDDAMDWIFGYAGPNETVDEVIRMTGALPPPREGGRAPRACRGSGDRRA